MLNMHELRPQSKKFRNACCIDAPLKQWWLEAVTVPFTYLKRTSFVFYTGKQAGLYSVQFITYTPVNMWVELGLGVVVDDYEYVA